MRVKKETILLAKIRRLIREAIHWHKTDDGMPCFWSSENYPRAKLLRSYNMLKPKSYPYYVKSDRAIKDIAERILKLIKKNG